MKEHKTILREEIESRLGSDSWDFAIARKVLEAKTDKTNRIWSFAPLATAAVSLMIFAVGIFYTYNPAVYDIDNLIFSYQYINDSDNFTNDIIMTEVELIINEAYPMR